MWPRGEEQERKRGERRGGERVVGPREEPRTKRRTRRKHVSIGTVI